MRKVFFIIAFSIITGKIFSQEAPAYIADVYNDIFRSMANGDVIKPKLIVVNDLKLEPNQREVATYYPQEKTIKVGLSFLELTRRFGADSSNARAHVISHELAHLFLKQGFTHSIGSGYASLKLNQLIISSKIPADSKLDESAADQWAFFYSHISGYKTTKIVSSLLDSIYRNYHLTDAMLSRYPSLKVRQYYADEASEKMKKMCEAFDFANIALVHGDYEMSAAIFNAILEEGFTSREIYSNLGTTHLLKAIQMKDSTELKYILPVQLDMTTRLNMGEDRGIVSVQEVNENLNRSVKLFRQTVKVDPDYSIAYLNLSMAYWLLNKNDSSEYFLKSALKDVAYIKSKAELFQAIVLLSDKSIEKIESGKNMLYAMAEKGNHMAMINKSIYDGNPLSKEKIYPEFIVGLLNIKLPVEFSNPADLLGNTFTRDKTKSLSCYESKNPIQQRTWKSTKPDINIVKQYMLSDGAPEIITEVEKDKLILLSEFFFETANATYLRFGDIILKVHPGGGIKYQIIKAAG